MAYVLNKTDGSVLTELIDSTIDQTSTDLTLIGKNVSNYGEYFNENLIKLLENYIQNFKLIIICKNNDNKINDKITYYQLPNFIDWKFDNFNWSNIFL